MHIDAIVEGLSLGFSKVANELLQAEFKGIILSLSVKFIRRIYKTVYSLEKYSTFAQNYNSKVIKTKIKWNRKSMSL